MERECAARVLDATPQILESDAVTSNLALWVRMFRAGFQRRSAGPQIASGQDDVELLDLLRAADERRAGARNAPDKANAASTPAWKCESC